MVGKRYAIIKAAQVLPKGETMDIPKRAIKAIGEVSIRVTDLDSMFNFYVEVLGLEVLRREQSFVFFRIAEGYAGHPQVLNLFVASERWQIESKSDTLSPEGTTLHHVAYNIDLADYEAEKERLEGLGIKVSVAEHAWVHVRSLYFPDPEGNLIELVAYDESVG
jgi:catechol 2,3-dioxygenase-like lactoylglutathione lyase family enzyme